VNIPFQQSWNGIFVFVIVGLDPTIQKISESPSFITFFQGGI
jgi:hypothetical protein